MFYTQTFLCICNLCKQPKYHVITCTEEYDKCHCSHFRFKTSIEDLATIIASIQKEGQKLFSGSKPSTPEETKKLDTWLIRKLMEKNEIFECLDCYEDDAGLEPDDLGEIKVRIESIEDLELPENDEE